MARKMTGADGQPKYFFSEEKAQAFIERKNKQNEYHVQFEESTGKYLILPNEQEE